MTSTKQGKQVEDAWLLLAFLIFVSERNNAAFQQKASKGTLCTI